MRTDKEWLHRPPLAATLLNRILLIPRRLGPCPARAGVSSCIASNLSGVKKDGIEKSTEHGIDGKDAKDGGKENLAVTLLCKAFRVLQVSLRPTLP